MCRFVRLFCIAILIAMISAPTAFAAKRVALVVGIDAYDHLPVLKKATNDSRAVANALTSLGFEVIVGNNLNRRQMNAKLAELDAKVAPGDTVFFYFAGHGVAIGAENYLLLKDLPKPNDGEENLVRDEAHSVDAIVRRVQSNGAAASFFVLDACRDNPLAAQGVRSIGGTRGLTRVEAPKGVFVLFSAGLGQTALDRLSDNDPDQNSVFTRKLVPLLTSPGTSHVALAKRVQREVDELAATVHHPQQPAYYDQIIGEIELSPPAPKEPDPQQPTPSAQNAPAEKVEVAAAPAQLTTSDPALDAWKMAKNTNSASVLAAFISKYSDSFYADLAKARLEELNKQQELAAREKNVRGIQNALKELECYDGVIDGQWGTGSVEALERFYSLANLGSPPEEPAEEMLNTLTSWKDGNCKIDNATPSTVKVEPAPTPRKASPPQKETNAAPKKRKPKAAASKAPAKERSVQKSNAPHWTGGNAKQNKHSEIRSVCENAQGCPANLMLGD